MPEIEAIYGNVRQIGRNANERPQNDRAAPSDGIRRISQALETFLGELQNENRSAFACAEAQALAKILNAIPQNANYSQITFTRPTGFNRQELWNPCKNCQVWLVEAGGWGVDKKYKLSKSALDKLPNIQQVVPQQNPLAGNFPTLAEAMGIQRI